MEDSGVVGTADRYRDVAEVEGRGSSPTYEAIALAVAEDRALINRIRGLSTEERQPNLLLAAAKLNGAPVDDPTAWIEHVHDHSESARGIVMDRWTQTNEAARAGASLLLLGQVSELTPPPAASAGLPRRRSRWRARRSDQRSARQVALLASPVTR